MNNTSASLRRQIDSAQGLQGVVRAMKALAASSIGQYERAVLALSDYDRIVGLALGACLRARSTPMGIVGPDGGPGPGPIGAVVFGSDQGLVGQFNEVVADLAIDALAALPANAHIWAVGERVHARLADAGLDVKALLAVPTSIEAVTPLVGQILVDTGGHASFDAVAELHLFYNRPVAGALYKPDKQRLLPLDERWRQEHMHTPWPTATAPEVLGGTTPTLRALIREHLFMALFRACAESLASENASRLAAMERADKNIDDLLETLSASFHRLRQSKIDEELFDVTAGVEALSAGGMSDG